VPALSSALLLFSAFNSEALTARTTNVINGHAPYLTFDGGVTKVTDIKGLLSITIPGIGNIKPNDPIALSPIELPRSGMSFNDIDMLVPPNTDTISLSTLIGPPNNYGRDDDGDGDITATGGNITLTITDKDRNPVARNEILTSCKSPYTVKLRSTAGTLRTGYGVPNSSTFNGDTAIYYLKAKDVPVICFARPDLYYGRNGQRGIAVQNANFAGPSTMWNPSKGFLVQSTEASGYYKNFPTTGAHGLHFDLDINGVDARELNWPSVSYDGVTATITPSSSTVVRVTLTGPYATSSQVGASSPSPVDKPSLPMTFEIAGRDSSGAAVVTYGFRLKQWFVKRSKEVLRNSQRSWCTGIGYYLPRVKDLTNAQGIAWRPGHRIPSGTPFPSDGNYYMRHIDAGFFSEWGRFAGNDHYWTINANSGLGFYVDSRDGNVGWAVYWDEDVGKRYAVCASSLP
jgi:hypothetical protein